MGRYARADVSEHRPTPDDDLSRLQEAGAARQERLGELLEKHRRRLLGMINVRMDPVLRARLGASDVLQEAYLEVADRLDAYLDNPRMPFFLWIRFITAQRLLQLYRHHAGAQKRDVRREARPAVGAAPAATSIALVDHLMASGITPSLQMQSSEFKRQLVAALDEMSDGDREMLVLRHFEEMSNAEAAETLGIELNTASQRYVRAVKRLGAALRSAGIDPATILGR